MNKYRVFEMNDYDHVVAPASYDEEMVNDWYVNEFGCENDTEEVTCINDEERGMWVEVDYKDGAKEIKQSEDKTTFGDVTIHGCEMWVFTKFSDWLNKLDREISEPEVICSTEY